MQRQKHRGLQKAQSPDQVDVEGRRERVPMILSLRNRAAGFVQTSIVDSHADQTAGTVLQGLAHQRFKQSMRGPLRAGVKKVFARPAVLLTSGGPDNARQRGAAQTKQRAESLADGAQEGSLLREDHSPRAHDFEPAFQQCRSGRRRLQRHYFLQMDENNERQKRAARAHSSGRSKM